MARRSFSESSRRINPFCVGINVIFPRRPSLISGVSLEQVASDYYVNSCSCALGIWCKHRLVLRGEELFVLSEESGLVFLPRGFDVLPSVELCVNGPHTRADHRDRSTQADKDDRDERIAEVCQEYPDLDDCYGGSGYWCPE